MPARGELGCMGPEPGEFGAAGLAGNEPGEAMPVGGEPGLARTNNLPEGLGRFLDRAAGFLGKVTCILSRVARFLARFRWVVALLVFLACVLLRVHGSSIGMYDLYLPTHSSEEVAAEYSILGSPRPIRSDEWAVMTPTFFSQEYNGYGLYSTRMGVNGENMIVDYYAPVWDLATLGKPLNWGYLLFGSEVGLSWHWCGQMILLLMVSFELFWILTKRDLPASAVGMLAVALSPVVQWWMLPHIPVVILYGMALFVIAYHAITSGRGPRRVLMVVLFPVALIGFVLSLFPAIQVTVGVVAIMLLVVCLCRDRDCLHVDRRLVVGLAIAVLFAVGVIVGFVARSWDDIRALMGTSYPGDRFLTGGYASPAALLTDLCSLFLPYKDSNYANNSEVATFIHLGPVFLVGYWRVRAALRAEGDGQRFVGDCLVTLLLVEIVFMVVGFPEWLARLTLLSYNNRMTIGYGWTATLFTTWSISVIARHKIRFSWWEVALVLVALACAYLATLDDAAIDYLGVRIAVVAIGLFVALAWLALSGRETWCLALLAATMVFCGATVNPMSRGIAPITNHPLSELVAQVMAEEPEARWLTAKDPSWVIANFIMANGAQVVNGTSFYPVGDYDVLDPTGQYRDAYNRYSNEAVFLDDGETWFESPSPDVLIVHLSYSDLETLDVRYLIAGEEAQEALERNGISADALVMQDGYVVYRLSYP